MAALTLYRIAGTMVLAFGWLSPMADERAAAQVPPLPGPTPEATAEATPESAPVAAPTAKTAAPLPTAPAQTPTPPPRMIELPAPRHSGGAPLMDVLSQPTAPLDLTGGRLSMQHLANLLWATSDVAHPSPDATPAAPRTAEVYVLLRAGAFRYDALANRLKQVVEQDIRGLSGPQDPTWRAPATLIYVINVDLASRLGSIDRDMSAAVGVGTLAQNVALYCASEGLATTNRPLSNRRALGRRLRLRPDQRVVAAQAIGLRQK